MMTMKNATCWLFALMCMAEPSPAEACTLRCGNPFAPLGTIGAPAHLPANGVFVGVMSVSTAPLSEVTLERTRAGVTETRLLGASYRGGVIPDVAPGDRLVLSTITGCSGGVSTTVIDVTEAAPLPTQLGVLEVEASRLAEVAVWDNGGACTSDLASAVAPYTVTLDSSAEPWADALVQSARVDDAPWWGREDALVAPRFVFAACEAPLESQVGLESVSVGAHRLRVDAQLRGFDLTLSSNEEMFSLECAATPNASCSVATPRRARGGLFTMTLTVLAMAFALLPSRRRSTRG
jgi:hypothetical protein